MRYLPHTPEDIASMLSAVGVESLEDLFSTVPQDCRRRNELNLPEKLTEWELNHHIDSLSDTMAVAPEYNVFMGAGSYEHFVPAAVSHLLTRSEFVTSYTPYQPEMSQGTLQAIFEYQTLAARLLGMEVANASQYDGASALAEAVLMAIRISRKKNVAVSRLIHPHYRRVLKTYLEPTDYEIVELPYLPNGTTDMAQLGDLDDLAAALGPGQSGDHAHGIVFFGQQMTELVGAEIPLDLLETDLPSDLAAAGDLLGDLTADRRE